MKDLIKILLEQEFSFSQFVYGLSNLTDKELAIIKSEVRHLNNAINDETARRINE